MKRSPLKRKKPLISTKVPLLKKKSSKAILGGNKRKPKTQAQLKKELDRVFSIYIRQKYSDENGMVKCYTCSTIKPWKEMQNGHWIPRNNLSTRFSEENCRVQCVGCNMFQKGRPDVFAVNLIKEGVDIVALEQTKYRVFKIDSIWYQERIAHYSSLIHTSI